MNAVPVPLVSVVVPTYRRMDLLTRCLEALSAQHFPRDSFEIIVCDDGCHDTTRRLVDEWPRHHPSAPRMRYIAVADTQGPAGARNRGWQAAHGEIIAFTDDDTIPAPDWLGQGLQAMTAGVAAVTGVTEMPLPNPPTDYERDAAGLTRSEFITANLFVRRSALVDVGGFDTRYTMAWREDSDLHFALLKHGYRIERAPAARVLHPVRPFGFAAGLGMQKKVMFDMLLRRKYPDLYHAHIRKHLPRFYLCVTAAFVSAVLLALLGHLRIASIAGGIWAVLTGWFFYKRLQGTRHTLRDVADLLITSVCIPVLSITWRVVGLIRFQRGTV
ncbi:MULTISPECIES: glycosyltransferase family 2 protein [unclassified Bordetella]|uniref:glycosyltransferase n=1 Tax=unclassified Bordetella TaxID=2630031 RepID=UPI001325E6D7|nr:MULTISPECIES: glycosyltransferase family A protein [unclassified Bordetella]MVW73189.1 glycosyltransferase [Bordetella sp. 15P40C-2]MVW79893.1 glycosyltransferase [Bordetella sp. 02P26C-1]